MKSKELGAILTIITMTYTGIYFLSVRVSPNPIIPVISIPTYELGIVGKYVPDSDIAARYIFYPIHWMDRRIRSKTWGFSGVTTTERTDSNGTKHEWKY